MAANHLPDWSFYCRELLFAKKIGQLTALE